MCLRIFNPYHFLSLFSFLNNFLQEGNILEKQRYLCLFPILSLGVNYQRCQIAQQVALKIIQSWKVTGINFCISYCLWLSCLAYLLFHGATGHYSGSSQSCYGMSDCDSAVSGSKRLYCLAFFCYKAQPCLQAHVYFVLSHYSIPHPSVSNGVSFIAIWCHKAVLKGPWCDYGLKPRVQCEDSDSATHHTTAWMISKTIRIQSYSCSPSRFCCCCGFGVFCI